ncbi:hypothetical protein FKW77_009130 [Venturia effusa]|uniref:Uncharacterized protein n=1 Tax=Venturia effusa TaxID=50376 RepID=A0A517LBM0_9PEZI|nr:hypothetical protein FKW77_009130 [Venturia effusa]
MRWLSVALSSSLVRNERRLFPGKARRYTTSQPPDLAKSKVLHQSGSRSSIDTGGMFKRLFSALKADRTYAHAPATTAQPDLDKPSVLGRKASVKIWTRDKPVLDSTSANPAKTQASGNICAVPKADNPRDRGIDEKIESKEIRDLCELVRKRYALDIEIWSLRDARNRDRGEVKALMVKVDAALARIRRTLDSWDRPDLFDSDSDWVKMQDIKKRIDVAGKREWQKHPPWVDLDQEASSGAVGF